MCLYIVHANSSYNFQAMIANCTVPTAIMQGIAMRNGFESGQALGPISGGLNCSSAVTASSICCICTAAYMRRPRL